MPYLTNENINYLIKMKTDTAIFAQLSMSKFFNFAPENSRGDPFLIQTSVTTVMAGNRARALRKGRDASNQKRIIKLADDEMSKAQACEEMILYERPLSGTIHASQQNQAQYPPPPLTSLHEFERAL